MRENGFETSGKFNRRELINYVSRLGFAGTVFCVLNKRSLFALDQKIIKEGIKEISGNVFINEQLIDVEQLNAEKGLNIPSDASISVGSSGSLIFVIGKDAFLLRRKTRLELDPAPNKKDKEISGFNLKAGGVLSVFAPKRRTLRTPTAIIGIKGTGVYLEADSEKTYVCTCYGSSNLQVRDAPEINENITTQYHDEPRYIYSEEKRIDPAPVINHSDLELKMLEALVDRVPPFIKADGIKDSKYQKYGY